VILGISVVGISLGVGLGVGLNANKNLPSSSSSGEVLAPAGISNVNGESQLAKISGSGRALTPNECQGLTISDTDKNKFSTSVNKFLIFMC
jgi:hypothetical protein